MNRKLSLALLAIALGLLVGCAKHGNDGAAAPDMASAEVERRGEAAAGLVRTPKAAAGEEAQPPANRFTADLQRKIIYNAGVELVVEDFDGVPDRVAQLVERFDAYVADSRFNGASGDSRRGKWTIRVPVSRFDAFVYAAKGLGELIDVSTTSRDVSEEYYDVEARIRNKTKEEERLLKLLEERPGELKDVLAIERELSRVREELERMQGRMRVLEDLTSLTTVELSIVEIRDYEPPEAPTLATRVRRTFAGSLSTLQLAGEGLLLAGVAITPWLPLVAVGLGVVYLAGRRAFRHPKQPGETPAQP